MQGQQWYDRQYILFSEHWQKKAETKKSENNSLVARGFFTVARFNFQYCNGTADLPLEQQSFEQVHSDNDASELEILGHFGTIWDNSEDFMMSLEHLDF